jgi:hypothetical protein
VTEEVEDDKEEKEFSLLFFAELHAEMRKAPMPMQAMDFFISLRCFHMNEGFFFLTSVELEKLLFTEGHNTIYSGMNGPVFSCVGVLAWTIPCSFLANENLSGTNNLATKALYTATFTVTISAVLRRPAGFLCAISGEILEESQVFASVSSLWKMPKAKGQIPNNMKISIPNILAFVIWHLAFPLE